MVSWRCHKMHDDGRSTLQHAHLLVDIALNKRDAPVPFKNENIAVDTPSYMPCVLSQDITQQKVMSTYSHTIATHSRLFRPEGLPKANLKQEAQNQTQSQGTPNSGSSTRGSHEVAKQAHERVGSRVERFGTTLRPFFTSYPIHSM